MKKRVLVGMSGGVDSSVAALLLLEQGYEVVGLTFKFTIEFDESDAISVANTLGIKVYETKEISQPSFIAYDSDLECYEIYLKKRQIDYNC